MFGLSFMTLVYIWLANIIPMFFLLVYLYSKFLSSSDYLDLKDGNDFPPPGVQAAFWPITLVVLIIMATCLGLAKVAERIEERNGV